MHFQTQQVLVVIIRNEIQTGLQHSETAATLASQSHSVLNRNTDEGQLAEIVH